MEKKPNKFFVGSVIIVLLLVGVVKVILSGMQELESTESQPASMKTADVSERIKPVGEVTVAKAQQAESTAASTASSEAADTSSDSDKTTATTASATQTASDESADTDVAAASPERGKKIVTQVCAMCHEAGMMGAPRIGNKSDWAPRIEKGMDTLYDHAMHGFNMMPARGGHPDLSDADIKAAVNYMVSLAK